MHPGAALAIIIILIIVLVLLIVYALPLITNPWGWWGGLIGLIIISGAAVLGILYMVKTVTDPLEEQMLREDEAAANRAQFANPMKPAGAF
jgi:membrane protein implicated in regulation of membrane protease activity